ncbi:MAG: serpin family protein [Bacteriovoracia bacterium]
MKYLTFFLILTSFALSNVIAAEAKGIGKGDGGCVRHVKKESSTCANQGQCKSGQCGNQNKVSANDDGRSALNEFSVPFFVRQFAENKDKNLIVSPFSARAAAQMAYFAAGTETRTQLAEGLLFPKAMSNQDIAGHYNQFIKGLIKLRPGLSDDDVTQIRVANAVFVNERFTLNPQYQAALASIHAMVRSGSFSDKKIVQEINDWVADQTNGKIKKLLSNLDESQRAVLVNALWTKGKWYYPFAIEEDDTFSAIDGKKANLTMLKHPTYEGLMLRHYQGADLEAVELPVRDGSVTFTVLLPAKDADFGAFVSGLTEERLKRLQQEFLEERGIVELPKFRVEMTMDLIPNLAQIIPLLFSEQADLSGMLAKSSGNLFITGAVQKTFIDVNKEGFEAAAATGMMAGATSVPPAPEFKFRADRPFVYYISKADGKREILFMGTFVKPEKK